MFNDQVAVVTGRAQGIGRAVAKRTARAGGRLVHWDTDLPLARASAQAQLRIERGVIALTKLLRKELTGFAIGVNVSPPPPPARASLTK